MDYRAEIVNLSKQFPNMRFGQFLINATTIVELDIFYMSDILLYEYCKRYVESMKRKNI